VLPLLKRFLEYHPKWWQLPPAAAPATAGNSAYGGSQVDVLIRAADAGCQLVDLELQSAAS